jgi:hypothetical protein
VSFVQPIAFPLALRMPAHGWHVRLQLWHPIGRSRAGICPLT